MLVGQIASYIFSLSTTTLYDHRLFLHLFSVSFVTALAASSSCNWSDIHRPCVLTLNFCCKTTSSSWMDSISYHIFTTTSWYMILLVLENQDVCSDSRQDKACWRTISQYRHVILAYMPGSVCFLCVCWHGVNVVHLPCLLIMWSNSREGGRGGKPVKQLPRHMIKNTHLWVVEISVFMGN